MTEDNNDQLSVSCGKCSDGREFQPFAVLLYKELAELRLRLQGKGPPKAVDYGEAKRKRSAPAKGFTETPAEQRGKPVATVATKPPETAE